MRCLCIALILITSGDVIANSSIIPSPTNTLSDAQFDQYFTVVRVVKDKYVVFTEALPALFNHNQLLVPLEQLADVLEFNIKVDIEQGMAEGWYITEENQIQIDLNKQILTVNGVNEVLTINYLYIYDDFYVDLTTIARWLPITLTFNQQQQELSVHTDVTLPYEARLAREARRSTFGLEKETNAGMPSADTFVTTPWQWLSIPGSDVNLVSRYDSQTNQISQRFNGYLYQDLLKQSSSLFFAGDDKKGLTSARLSLSGQSEQQHAALLTNWEFGDIFTTSDRLASSAIRGLGIQFSNFSDATRLYQEDTDLSGNAPPGWDIEVYRNNTLITATTSNEQGIYTVNDFPLIMGTNTIEIRQYGPRGELTTDTNVLSLHHELIAPGATYYQASIVDEGADLLGFSGSKNTSRPHLTLNTLTGLTTSTSLTTRLVSQTIDVQDRLTRRNFITGGIRTSFQDRYLRLELSNDLSNRAFASGLTLQQKIGSASLLANITFYEDTFHGDFNRNNSDTLKYTSTVRLNDRLTPALMKHPLSVNMTTAFEAYYSGNKQHDTSLQIGINQPSVNLSNTLNLKRSLIGHTREHTINGNFQVNSSLSEQAGMRASLDYDVSPSPNWQSISTAFDYRYSDTFSINTSYRLQRGEHNRQNLNISMNKRFSATTLSVTAGLDGQADYTLSFNVNFSLQRNNHAWRINALPGRKRTTLTLHPFLIQAGHKTPIKDATFKLNGQNPSSITYQNGRYVIHDLPDNSPVSITMEGGIIGENIYQPQQPVKHIKVRKGRVLSVSFPVNIIGELDGTLTVLTDKGQQPLRRATVTVKQQGKVIKKTQTDSGGYYLIEQLPTGRYTLSVTHRTLPDTEQLTHKIELTPEQDILSGVDLTIQCTERCQFTSY